MPFDEDKAEQAIRFFEKRLTHTKKPWAGKPFILLPWQRELTRTIFGTVREDGFRQYRKVYCEIPKKNGKSDYAAGIALKLLVADGEEGGEIYSAAADREQASLVFNVAAQMVRNDRKLSSKLRIIDSRRRIIAPKTGNIYQVLSSDVKTKHGFNVSGLVFDELHAQPDRKLYDVLTDGSGDARTQPLFFFITTAGFDRNSVCWEVHEYARRVKEGIIEDQTFLPLIYSLDEEENWEDAENWKKVNPSLGHTITLEKLQNAFREAKELPNKENTFRRLRLNQWVKQEIRYIPMKKWDACPNKKINEEELRGRRCYGGLDLSATSDLTAWVLWFPPDDWEEGEHILLCRFWIPEAEMDLKIRRDHVPYDIWKKQGYIQTTPGETIDYRYVFRQTEEDFQKFDIQDCNFDRWGSEKIRQDITELVGKDEFMIQFGQGDASMNAPTVEILRLVKNLKVNHGGNPVLRWHADSLTVKQGPTGLIKPVKPDRMKQANRVDGMVAAIMALDRAMRNKPKNPDDTVMEVW